MRHRLGKKITNVMELLMENSLYVGFVNDPNSLPSQISQKILKTKIVFNY